jgi:hypothetical protein
VQYFLPDSVDIFPHYVGKFLYFRLYRPVNLKESHMIRPIIFSVTLLLALGATSSAEAQKSTKNKAASTKSEVKFIEEIEIGMGPYPDEPILLASHSNSAAKSVAYSDKKVHASVGSKMIEGAHALQLKFALLLDTEVEAIENLSLFNLIDDWFGTRYRYGGTSKSGIDCSAFMQVLYAGVLGLTLPRTAKEQFKVTRPVSRFEAREGDLVFFNTTGGVSHVGFYLQNNKFVHAASSEGVTVSDLDEAYWSRRIIGFGRYENTGFAQTRYSQP